jgi:nucleotide-binding universal stress UspA family protein
MVTNPLPVLSIPVRIPKVTQILVPIDFSGPSKAAFWRAVDIAKIYNASLMLLHVMSHQTANGMATLIPGALLKIEEDLQADLDRLQRMAAAQDVVATTTLRKGHVLDSIREVLVSEPIDLLVIATHGGRGVHGVLLGSIAERVIRSITIPVLTVGNARNQPAWDERGARHILYAGDFRPETLCGLSLALGIQETTGAQLSVVHVVPAKTTPQAVHDVRTNIASIVPPGTGIHIPTGAIGSTVCQVARQLNAGLITLGVHKNSLAREIFGSNLLEILVNAPCPVLSVRQCDSETHPPYPTNVG